MNDPTLYFKCYRCHETFDRAKEVMMHFSGGNQCYGLQRPIHTYCFNCWLVVSRENVNPIGGLTGREFANVASELMNEK